LSTDAVILPKREQNEAVYVKMDIPKVKKTAIKD